MLEELAKKDKQWRRIAFNICKDKMLADDLTNDMYLKLYKVDKEINDFYVIVTIKNLFLQHIRNDKALLKLNDVENYILSADPFEPDDYQAEILKEVHWLAKGYLELLHDNSLRQVSKQLKTDVNFIHRTVTKERERWVKK